TETVYGLAGNAYNEAAVLKIFRIKQRPSFDPLIVHAGSIQQATRFTAKWPTQALRLAQHFWPGPLTLLLKKKPLIPDIVTAGLPTVGVRIPQHTLTLALLQQLSFPLAAPSANPFGYTSPTTPQHVLDQLGEAHLPYILEGGACPVGIESTIVGFDNEQPVVYRLGGIALEALEEMVGPVAMASPVGSQPQVPGTLTSHYAPSKPLRLGTWPALQPQYAPQQVGILAFDKLWPGVPPGYQVVLSPASDLDEAARNLFAALRTLDTLPVEVILTSLVPDIGMGKAINDRLRRAAAPKDAWIEGS
ncbi:MAG: L-threonylcarbamoyladenylate synthase, partial [Bacteroidota bacterium]